MSKQEKTTGELLTLEQLKNTIPNIIADYCTANKIEDLSRESNNKFNALLLHINKTLITPNKKTLITVDHGTNKQTDYNKLYELLEIYISLCLSFDSTVTVTGFSIFTGVERNTLYEMQYNTVPKVIYNNITKETHIPDENTKTGANVWAKLRDFEEQTTLDCRKYNDLRIIARLNRITGGAYRDYTQLDTGTNRQQLSTAEIENKYGISDNATVKGALPVSDTG